MRVECNIEKALLEDEDGREVEGVIGSCRRCGHRTESFGTEEPSVRRCLVLMRVECPLREANYYIEVERGWLDERAIDEVERETEESAQQGGGVSRDTEPTAGLERARNGTGSGDGNATEAVP